MPAVLSETVNWTDGEWTPLPIEAAPAGGPWVGNPTYRLEPHLAPYSGLSELHFRVTVHATNEDGVPLPAGGAGFAIVAYTDGSNIAGSHNISETTAYTAPGEHTGSFPIADLVNWVDFAEFTPGSDDKGFLTLEWFGSMEEPTDPPGPPGGGDGIVFEQIPNGETTTQLPDSNGHASISVRVRGFESTLQQLGGAGLHRIELRNVPAIAEDVEPPIVAGGFTTLPLVAFGTAPGVEAPVSGTAVIALRARGFESPEHGGGTIPVDAVGFGDVGVGEPPIVLDPLIYVGETLELGATMTLTPYALLRSALAVATRTRAEQRAVSRLTSRMSFTSRVAIVFRMLVAEGLALGADVQTRPIARVIEALVLGGAVASYAEARAAVVSALAFGAWAEMRAKEQLTDTLDFEAAIAEYVAAAEQLVETLELGDVLAGGARIAVVVRDTLELSDTATSTAEVITSIQEHMGFVLRLSLDDGDYLATTINTANKATSGYTNYPFNSFAKLGRTYYGMAPDGIRRLEGPDDAGDPIAARVRLAFTNMGSIAEKRIRAAYLAYTATGDLRVKVTCAGKDGRLESHHYRLAANPGDVPQTGRVKIGEGLKAAYWGFELEAIDGAAFNVDVMEIVPIVLQQKMGGTNGGKR
ncbi:MAG TPA: hypothetical protein VFE72_08860 [Lysobacter sp.]|nr:hypothetical protein [Lysobacter sp.]